jgi:hypothetical protein
VEEEEVPVMAEPRIFVSLASLPDGELIPTVKNLYGSAQLPERVDVSLVAYGQSWQTKRQLNKLMKKYPTLRVELKDIPGGSFEDKITVLGVGANRNEALRKYSGQDYVLQIDSHALVAEHWDSKLVTMHREAQELIPHKVVVLTAYATGYAYVDGKRTFLSDCFTYSSYTPSRKFFEVIPGWDDLELNHFKGEKYIPSAKFCANFAFSTGAFALAESLPDRVLFYEEEPIQSVELFSKGFALVFPIVSEPLVGHLYVNDIKSRKQRRMALMDYAPDQEVANSAVFMARVKETYLTYLARNRDKVKAYEKYAKTNLRLGAVSPALKVPEEF